ncbi:MAG: transposase family protein [candidate division WOR-3 bacterium]|nr:transposase family protein [candidate division WOR-3 bacterium]
MTKGTFKRYQKAPKKEKTKMLNEYVALTGYTRHHASWVLRTWSNRKPPKRTRLRPRIYDRKVFEALRKVWIVCDCICGKRLAPYLKEIVPVLIAHNELEVDTETRQKLVRISAATIDRLLAPERAKYLLKPRSRAGPALMNRIPVKTFSQWDRTRPGDVQVDLVEHNGGDPRGEYACTLVITDVYSGWTELAGVRNKAQVWVHEALKCKLKEVPFPLKGLHSDGGKEFINDHLERYCEKEGITFTHSRPYKKNDNFCVEQKNGNVVRRAVGYGRHSGEREVSMLNRLYESLRLYVNYFQPMMKLAEKSRTGSKVSKRYDEAKTPYRRLLEYTEVSPGLKELLNRRYGALNPAELKREITRYQQELFTYSSRRRGIRKPEMDKTLLSGRI